MNNKYLDAGLRQNAQYVSKIPCKGTKKNAHMQIYVRFF